MQGDKRFRSLLDNPVLHQAALDESFFLKTVDALPYPLLVLELDYQVSMANRAARKLYCQDDTPGNALCYQLVYGRNTPCGQDQPCPLDVIRATGKPLVADRKKHGRPPADDGYY